MDLTEENKKHMDSLNYKQLLSEWNLWFQGETGNYWSERLAELLKIKNLQKK